jgi:two-component sensor histidine kinase
VVVWVFDAKGDSVLTNDPPAARVNVADREYFHALRAGSEWHIARLLTARVGPVKAFGIGRRIERNGRFMGVAIIAVRAELMAEFWSTLGLGQGSTVALVRDDGWLVARFPVPDDTIDLSASPLFTTHLPNAPEGSYSSGVSPADGVRRIVGYRRVPNAPLVAVAALARAELAAALEQNRFLLRETHHRIKNNLQTVSSLVHLQPGTPEVKETMFRRLAAMSAVLEHIYRSDQYAVLDLSEYLPTLIAGLQVSHGSAATVEHRLAPMEIDADRAQALGLIVSEVVSNAFKHAFPNGRAGAITVELDRIDATTARLRITDDGIGFTAAPDTSGMGGRLVSGFVQRLDGESAYSSEGGTRFTLTFPLAAAFDIRTTAQNAHDAGRSAP